MKQFDIYTVSGGTFSGKPRPAVIIQSTAFEDFDSITVIPLTTEVRVSEFRIKLSPNKVNGLLQESFAMVDKITTIKKIHLGDLTGILDPEVQDTLEDEVAKFIGLK